MSLSVQNREAHRLAQAIAAETGQDMTRVVINALRERHAKLHKDKGKASFEELTALAKQVSATLKKPAIDHGDLLYDEYGLPK